MSRVPGLLLLVLLASAGLAAQGPARPPLPVRLPPWEPAGSAAPVVAPVGAEQILNGGAQAPEPSAAETGTRAVEDERRAESKAARDLLKRHPPPSRTRYLGIAILVGVLAMALVIWALLRPRRR
jgi:hypothetical protein